MNKYKWYAKFKFGGYLYLEDGGLEELVAYVGDKPTLFRTKEACRKWVRGMAKGVIYNHKEGGLTKTTGESLSTI